MNNKYKNSVELLERATKVIPMGSQTFSKSYTQYPEGMSPLFLKEGKGGRVWDFDGNEYVDLVCGLLPVVLGYCDPDVDKAIKMQLQKGITLSLPSILETELAERLVELIPCAEMVRFGKNGTDATSAAIRLARAHTGRDHIIALGYHGWQDWYIGATTRNKGVPDSVRELTHKLPFNDLDSIKQAINQHPDNIAAIILEPMSSVEPHEGYLEQLRLLTKEKGIVLIFDEIITGFRYSLGGAQELFGVTPDLAAFGKAMGNGMPISAVVGSVKIMKEMEEIFFSGTFGGEALSLAAAIAVIDKMKAKSVIEHLWSKGEELSNQVVKLINKYSLSKVIDLSGKDPWKIVNFHDHEHGSKEEIKTLFMIEMLDNGVLTQGTHNICYAHTDSDIEHVVEAYDRALHVISDSLLSNTLRKNLNCSAISPVFQVRK